MIKRRDSLSTRVTIPTVTINTTFELQRIMSLKNEIGSCPLPIWLPLLSIIAMDPKLEMDATKLWAVYPISLTDDLFRRWLTSLLDSGIQLMGRCHCKNQRVDSGYCSHGERMDNHWFRGEKCDYTVIIVTASAILLGIVAIASAFFIRMHLYERGSSI